MATRHDSGSNVTSAALYCGEETLMVILEEFCAKQRKKEGIKNFGENLPAQMKVLSEIVNGFSGLYREGIIAAMTDSIMSEHIEGWLHAVKTAFQNESGRSDNSFLSYCPKKGEMSEDEYKVYALGYLTAIKLHGEMIDMLLKGLDLG